MFRLNVGNAVLVVYFSYINSNQMDTSYLNTQIFYGKYALSGQWPWMVWMRTFGSEFGGALISDQYIATCAHTLFDIKNNGKSIEFIPNFIKKTI